MFKDPVAPRSWDGVRDATVLPPACISHEFKKIVGEEDCLYLNVYTPKVNVDEFPKSQFSLSLFATKK